MPNSQTQQKPKDSLSIQNSVDTNDKDNSRLLERHNIKFTPFYIVGSDDIGYKITWGKYSFTDEPHKSHEDAMTWFDENTWTIVHHMIAIGVAHGISNLDKKEQ